MPRPLSLAAVLFGLAAVPADAGASIGPYTGVGTGLLDRLRHVDNHAPDPDHIVTDSKDVYGNAGLDRLDARDGRRDRLDGGRGRDDRSTAPARPTWSGPRARSGRWPSTAPASMRPRPTTRRDGCS
jgi:hypothetical protein